MTDAELVKQVAIKVMGWVDSEWCLPGETRVNEIAFDPIPNANHWWMVAERMREKGYTLKLGHGLTVQGVLTWVKFVADSWDVYYHDEVPGRAVCEAALKAVENE